jgi:hypothetical protein
VKRIFFVDTIPRAVEKSHHLDFSGAIEQDGAVTEESITRIELDAIYRRYGDEWKHLFVDWLGWLNCNNTCLEWWAYTSTAKNFLSSPLGNQVFQALALCKIAMAGDFETLYVTGASRAQIRFLKVRLKNSGVDEIQISSPGSAENWVPFFIFFRLCYHFLRLWSALFLAPRRPQLPEGPFDLYLFTYIDGAVNGESDAFFGKLQEYVAQQKPGSRVLYTGFVHSPLRKTLSRLRNLSNNRYWPIFLELTVGDLLWALGKTAGALNTRRFNLVNPGMSGAAGPLDVILRDVLRWDIAKGGYFFNLLVYRAAIRFAGKFRPAKLIYPYENKSLEKMLILGVRQALPRCSLVGYQHTSITLRHTTLLFSPGEAANTPLPDKIITVGEITRRYLEQHGNYPAGIFVTGCALRQTGKDPLKYSPIGHRKIRVLLALSSSRQELVRSIQFFQRLSGLTTGFELGVRPHPEFPLSKLPPALLTWVKQNAKDFSGTKLLENIAWCDVTAYVSSTVALESLIAGKPAINFRVGDTINPDPVLGDVPFCWRVKGIDDFTAVLSTLSSMPNSEYKSRAQHAKTYLGEYLRPVSPTCIRKFIEPVNGNFF